NPDSSKGSRPLYKFIRDHGGITNWDFEILKNTYTCNSLDEKNLKREYLANVKPTLNNSIPLRTRKERNDLNRDKINARQRELYQLRKSRSKSVPVETHDANI
ncbi:MAG: hypothetical protein ACKPKO_08115, partial [Candidatus Fonsibacter sp.]